MRFNHSVILEGSDMILAMQVSNVFGSLIGLAVTFGSEATCLGYIVVQSKCLKLHLNNNPL